MRRAPACRWREERGAAGSPSGSWSAGGCPPGSAPTPGTSARARSPTQPTIQVPGRFSNVAKVLYKFVENVSFVWDGWLSWGGWVAKLEARPACYGSTEYSEFEFLQKL